MKETIDINTVKLELVIQRDTNYKAIPVSGFSISGTSDGQIVIEPFTDLPPVIDESNPFEKTQKVIRQMDRCYFFSQLQAKLLIDTLLNMFDDIHEKHKEEKNDE